MKKLVIAVFSGLVTAAGSALAVNPLRLPDHANTFGLLAAACVSLLFVASNLKRKVPTSA
jgi:hypothetical protein